MRSMRAVISALVLAWALAPSMAGAAPQVPFEAGELPDRVERSSHIAGVITDERGRVLPGVRVLAVGTALAVARSDAWGRFALMVPAGDYLLKVSRSGYLSTLRERIRAEVAPAVIHHVVLARAQSPDASAPPQAADEPSAVAWRLRHLPRTVLRDERPTFWAEPPSAHGDMSTAVSHDTWHRDVRGYVDLATTSAWSPSAAVADRRHWPRGVAHVLVGAPVAEVGAWQVRAALTPGDASAWAAAGEFRADERRRHAFRAGLEYSALTLAREEPTRVTSSAEVHRAGSAYGFDRWSVGRGSVVEFGGRFDVFDYLATPAAAGGTLGAEQSLGRVTLAAKVVRRHASPDASMPHPPTGHGVWLPPDRMFVSSEAPFGRATTLDRVEGGGHVAIATGDRPVIVYVLGFRERARDQYARSFTTHARRDGPPAMAYLGTSTVDAVSVGVDSRLGRRLRGRIDYTHGRLVWSDVVPAPASTSVLPVLAGVSGRRVHDVTTRVEAVLPATETALTFVARVSDSYLRPEGANRAGRFSIELRQPLGASRGHDGIEIFFSARHWRTDVAERGFVDDLVTVALPLRMTGGIHVRF